MQERRAFRARVEQQRSTLVTDVRGDQQREAVVRAADRPAGQRGQSSRGEEPGPLGDDVLRRGGEAVGRVVDEHEHVQPVHGTEVAHGLSIILAAPFPRENCGSSRDSGRSSDSLHFVEGRE